MKLILAYKNFAANRHVSHIGLGVSAMNTCKMLRSRGIATEVWPLVHARDLAERLHREPATHVVISAPWIPSVEIQTLITRYPDTRFAVNCHSNVGFLQADSNGVKLVREAMEIECGAHNFHISGNSLRFCNWLRTTYARPCTYLPNLYWLDGQPRCRPQFYGGTLRIGAFGAVRPLKNFMSAAAAAVTIARGLKADLELYISSGRMEGGGDVVMRAVHAMVDRIPGVRIMQNGWQSWPTFRQSVGNMHLLLQPSYTESFNMVTADGVAEGVASVVSHAIDWAPDHWKAMADDVLDIARVGRALLRDPQAVHDGYHALKKHNSYGIEAWMRFLDSTYTSSMQSPYE